EAHYNLANLYAEVGNYALAKLHYRVSIEVEPEFPNSYFNLGLVLALEKDYREAVKALLRYRESTPDEDHRQTDSLVFALQQGIELAPYCFCRPSFLRIFDARLLNPAVPYGN